MAARAAQTPPEWFPDGRNPWTHLYTPEVLDQIAKALGGCEDRTLDKVGYDLALSAETAVVLEDEVALNCTLSQRRNWIERNILEPVRTLREALHPNNAGMTSEWPDSVDLDEIDKLVLTPPDTAQIALLASQAIRAVGEPKKRARREKRSSRRSVRRRDEILAELDWLERWSEGKLRYFAAKHGPKPETERRDDFVERIARIYVRHFPERSRRGIRSDGQVTPLMMFVQAAALPILGDTNLTAQVKKALPSIRLARPRRKRE
jgi:hypothetical protein